MARVLVTHSDSHPMRLDLIREELDDCDVEGFEVPTGGLQQDVTDELIDALEGVEVLILRPGLMSEAVIEAAEDLQIIALLGSGYDHIDVPAATRHGVVVIHSPENPGPSVAEHTIGFIFSLLRDLPDLYEKTSDGRWAEARETTIVELSGITIGIAGLGVIGFDVARALTEAFDATVIAYDPFVAGEHESNIYPRYDRNVVEEAGVELTNKAALFERSDLVSVHTPLTEETEGFVSHAELNALEGGYLVNTSRGGTVDEAALIEAVETGKLEGVALDVMEEEPPNSDNPLLDAEEVWITPHLAGLGNRLHERGVRNLGPKIKTALAGDRPKFVVNPEVYEN